MPPPDQKQPRADRRAVLAFLDKNNIPIGGTRASSAKAEYESTIRNLLYLPDFKLPLGFPNDIEYHGNNIGESRFAVLEAYASVARDDQIFPPPKPVPQKKTWSTGEDIKLRVSAAAVHGNALCSPAWTSCEAAVGRAVSKLLTPGATQLRSRLQNSFQTRGVPSQRI